MQVLITGGAGFIGTRLARELRAGGNDVVVFDSLHPQVHQKAPSLDDGVDLYAADVRDSSAWDRLFVQFGAPDVVVHLAAETGTGQSLNAATRHSSTNVVGTTELTDALVRHAVKPGRIVLASSRAVYGEGAWRGIDETLVYPGPRSGEQLAAGQWDPTPRSGVSLSPVLQAADIVQARPTNVYAATKLAQEHLLEAWCSSYGVPLSILRLQNVFGPGQAVGNAYTGVLTFFARQIASGEQVEVFEDGQIVRDFVFVDDVVRALASAARHSLPGMQRLDIGSGEPSTLLAVAQEMSRIGAAPEPVVTGAYRLGDVRAAAADVSEARRSLSWSPDHTLSAGLRSLLEWMPSQL